MQRRNPNDWTHEHVFDAGSRAAEKGTRLVMWITAAMMAVEGLLVVGTWDDGGDQANVFAAFRSVAKLVQTDSLAACCAAIRQNAKSAPPAQAGLYILAAGTCDSVRRNPGAIAQIKSALRGLNVPSSCR